MRCIVFAAAFFVGAHTAHAQAPEIMFEGLAREIVALGPGDFVYGFRQPSPTTPPEVQQPIDRFAGLLANATWRAADLLPLLRHPSPKVRTLALVALYDLEDPHLLPEILPLVTDTAATFPAVQSFAMAYGMKNMPPPMLAQTVGEIATAIVRVYMESGGFSYGPTAGRNQPGFQEYWKPRARRTSVAGWWSLRLARAGHATLPTPKDRSQAIRRLRSRINSVNDPDRTYILLWLHGDPGSDALVSAGELIKLLQALGPDHLLDLLTRKIRSDDPDLQPRPNNNYKYGRMCQFVLQNARALLRPGDAPALLAQERWERDYQKHGIGDPMINAWWGIAVAELSGQAAASNLVSAYGRLQDDYQGFYRLDLVEAMWRQTGNAQTAVDWFYRELAHPTSQEAYYLEKILNTPGRPASLFARAMIADTRFDELNWKSLEVLAKALNVDVGDVSFATIDFYYKDMARAKAEYPKETDALLLTLARWRTQLRQAVASPTR